MRLLWRKYLSSAVNGLTNSARILDITKRDFFQLNCLHSDQYIWERCCRLDWNSVSACLPCYFSKGPLKGDFLHIDLTTFFGVRKFKHTSSIRVIFFLEILKIKSRFRKCKKKIAKMFFCLWDNCIWICCNELSLLRREYLSSAVNVLTNSPENLHITKRDFLEQNFLETDQ